MRDTQNSVRFCPGCPNACSVNEAIVERVSKRLGVAFVTDIVTDETFEAGAVFKDASGKESAFFLPNVSIESIAACISPRYTRGWSLRKVPSECGAAYDARKYYAKLHAESEAKRKAYEEKHPPKFLDSEGRDKMLQAIENGTFRWEDWVN